MVIRCDGSNLLTSKVLITLLKEGNSWARKAQQYLREIFSSTDPQVNWNLFRRQTFGEGNKGGNSSFYSRFMYNKDLKSMRQSKLRIVQWK